MNPRLAHLLIRLYPRAWRERYGSEFEEVLESSRGDLRTLGNVVRSALYEHIFPTRGHEIDQIAGSLQFQSWCVRAPWAMFGLAPIFLLAVAYFIACLILWSGWRIFLPGTNTPFVRLDGFAIFYFGIGRLLYYSAPILIGWGIGLIAVHQRLKAIWPTVGLILIALIGGISEVHASRTTAGGGGAISMDFAFRSSFDGLFHALVILSVTGLSYFIWRLQKAHTLSS